MRQTARRVVWEGGGAQSPSLDPIAGRWKKRPKESIPLRLFWNTTLLATPITGLKWTSKTTEKIADLLRQIDISISARTVGRLLYQMNFSPRVNRKKIATNSSPYRDHQFQHISALLSRCTITDLLHFLGFSLTLVAKVWHCVKFRGHAQVHLRQ